MKKHITIEQARKSFDSLSLKLSLSMDHVHSDVEAFMMAINSDANDRANIDSGRGNPFYGQHHTEETKSDLREQFFERLKDEKYRNSMRRYGERNNWFGVDRSGEKNPMFGSKREMSATTRAKMSVSQKDRTDKRITSEKTRKATSERNSKKYKVTTPENEIFEIKNLSQYVTTVGLNLSSVYACVSGGRKIKGYLFERIINEET